MNRYRILIALGTVLILAGCQSHPEMQYAPEKYAKLRGIELITTPTTRPFELVANVEGFGGRYTAKQTMINGMIDEAHKLGARALLPVEFTESGNRGSSGARTGLDQFVFTENGRTVTKGRAIRWLGN